MRRPACPICRQPVAPRHDNRAYPFCSERCRLIDLGRWLDGQYRISLDASDDGRRK